MCLEIKKSDRIKFTWFKPIVVYKLLYRSSKNELLTIYRDKKVKIGRRYFSFLFRKHDEVNRGLHSLSDIDQAWRFKSRKETLVECQIPKFSWYYQGKFYGLDSIASSSLKYIRILESNPEK